MPIPHKPGQRGLFERDGDALIGEHYRSLVRRGQAPDQIARREGERVDQIPGGVKVEQTAEEGEDD